MHVSADRLLVEYAAVTAAVRLLISAFGARALRTRAAEVETDLPIPRPSRWNPIIDLSVGLLLIAYIAVWHFLAARMNVSDLVPTQGFGLFMVAILIIYGLADRHDLVLLSHYDFGVNGLQFDAGVADFELPVHATLFGVAALMPCGCFRSQ
jgi:hypothetical protein